MTRCSSRRMRSEGNPAPNKERYRDAIFFWSISPRNSRSLRSIRWRTNAAGSEIRGGFLQSGFDVAIRDAACAQVSRDTVGSLFPVFRAVANELFGVARVIQQVFAFQTLNC